MASFPAGARLLEDRLCAAARGPAYFTGDEASGVARLYRTEPERWVGRLRWQYIGDVRALNVLVMQSRGIEHGVLAGCIRSIDVHCQARAISHGDTDISLLDHQFVSAGSAAVSADVLQWQAR